MTQMSQMSSTVRLLRSYLCSRDTRYFQLLNDVYSALHMITWDLSADPHAIPRRA